MGLNGLQHVGSFHNAKKELPLSPSFLSVWIDLTFAGDASAAVASADGPHIGHELRAFKVDLAVKLCLQMGVCVCVCFIELEKQTVFRKFS